MPPVNFQLQRIWLALLLLMPIACFSFLSSLLFTFLGLSISLARVSTGTRKSCYKRSNWWRKKILLFVWIFCLGFIQSISDVCCSQNSLSFSFTNNLFYRSVRRDGSDMPLMIISCVYIASQYWMERWKNTAVSPSSLLLLLWLL